MKRVMASAFCLAVLLAASWVPAFAGVANPSPVPEPSTILLVAGVGGALLLVRQLRKKK